jgi:hypothetical protein
MFFQSDDSFDTFSWKSETTGPAGKSGNEVSRTENGLMNVTPLYSNREPRSLEPGPASIPNFLLDLVFSQMLEAGQDRLIVDTIEPDGTITPALISRIKARGMATAEKNAAYVLKLELLDPRGFSEVIYLNNKRQISKILLQQEQGIYIVERATLEDILGQFPEKAHEILQRSKLGQEYPQ